MESITPTQHIPYPQGIAHYLVRAPLLGYRLGLGRLLNALFVMVLVTQGRKSGKPRYAPIEYRRHGSKIYVISAWGERPNWYQNLLANPVATVQLGGRAYDARARVVENPAEALRALYLFRRIAPARYDTVMGMLINDDTVNARTLPDLSGQFTIICLDITGRKPTLPVLAPSLAWLWLLVPVAAVGVTALVLANRSRRDTANGG
ncbi:MAG: nitroreductase family deazaflavin-dependent oxidoreductase [Anaerolineaceae bacterium]|nr:nitroreductase family deazaflavin-dependent oxidoreductase [Anaerolineaceae bacterium]